MQQQDFTKLSIEDLLALKAQIDALVSQQIPHKKPGRPKSNDEKKTRVYRQEPHFCPVCHVTIKRASLDNHLKSESHKNLQQQAESQGI